MMGGGGGGGGEEGGWHLSGTQKERAVVTEAAAPVPTEEGQ